ncbi:MAG: T9SS type A sorting domain-containing protein [Bacteroidales bacterium]|nr:T9SS type A sorting domain-containing protein [Bacteroidales bacterium]
MKKTALFLVSVLLVLGGAAGQNGNSTGRFEWVRGYAPGEHVSIVGSVTDSLGNLYILGSFNFESRWENGELIMPITPHNGAQNGVNTLIAKISPEGEMVWKKVIHGNYCPSQPHDIKALGDTAFACLVTMPLATINHYLYYLDTLIETSMDQNLPLADQIWPNYPMNAKYDATPMCLALITFDFNGNVQDQHFLQMSYLDRDGMDIANPPNSLYGPESWLKKETCRYPSFAIDNEGNIYISRWVYDVESGGPGVYYSAADGSISAVKFWCDHRLVGVVPSDSILQASPQLLKFAQHFDTLLESRYVFQSIIPSFDGTAFSKIKTDNENNLYVYGTLRDLDSSLMLIDTVRNMYINKTPANVEKGFLVKFDSLFLFKNVISLIDSIIPSNYSVSNTAFNDISFDYDSNLMFLCAATGRGALGDTTSFYSILTYQGIPLNRLKNDAFVMSFHLEDSLHLYTYGRVASKMGSSVLFSALLEQNRIVCQNNRVIIQAEATGGFRFPGHTVNFPRIYDASLGFVIFDYQGNVIGGDSYSAYDPANISGPLAIRDSILYLCNRISGETTFGDIHVPSRGDYFACIAKYVDTAFMTPYVAPTPGPGPEGISEADTLAINSYPNPVRDMLHIAIDDMVIHATAISLTGVRRQVPAKGNTLDLEALQPGVYILEIATMNRKYHHKIIKL